MLQRLSFPGCLCLCNGRSNRLCSTRTLQTRYVPGTYLINLSHLTHAHRLQVRVTDTGVATAGTDPTFCTLPDIGGSDALYVDSDPIAYRPWGPCVLPKADVVFPLLLLLSSSSLFTFLDQFRLSFILLSDIL